MSTISDGTTSITPLQILGYKSERSSRNVWHEILGSNVPSVSLRPAALRSGKLTAVMPDRAAAVALESLLGQAKLLTYTDAIGTLGMTFGVEGEISAELDDDSSTLWLVTWGYREVA